jgi:hypothetical protein
MLLLLMPQKLSQSRQVQVQLLPVVRQSLWCHCCKSPTARHLEQQHFGLWLLLLLLLLGAMVS